MPEVLRAMGLSDSTIGLITAYRDGPDGTEEHGEDGVFEAAGVAIVEALGGVLNDDDRNLLISNAFGVSSRTFRVVSEATLERPRSRVRIDAVIQRGSSDGDVPKIMAWREG